jgi:toluene monooxygenase system protein B
MALFPFISNFQNDFVLQLVAVDSDDDMDKVAAAAAHHSLNRRVRPQPGKTLRVRLQGADQPFARNLKVEASGIAPMSCLEIYYE